MLEELIHLDKEAFLYLNGLGTASWDGFWMYLSKKISFITIPLYLLLFSVSYKSLGLKKTGILLIAIALMITCTDQLANFFKYGVKRLRPCYDQEVMDIMRLVKGYCGGKFGYFSAHAASTMAVASFFCVLFGAKQKLLIGLLFVWALLVGYSRIYIGVHFPLDVLTGIGIGLLLGWLYAKLYIFALLKIKS